MRYHSTRGGVSGVSFKDVLLSGYASDGGMFLPENIPEVSRDTLKTWAGLPYHELAYSVVSMFVEEEDIPGDVLKDILKRSFGTFSKPEVVPVTRLCGGLVIVELFHGRSLAFKDLSMSCIGNFYSHFLSDGNKHMTLLVCTSGDTGSSAIEAVRGLSQVDIVVMLPRDRCARIQELMMTTVMDDNVHVYRMDGSSDDIDIVVRELFADSDFVKTHNLASPSSLNFARGLIQLVHFFYTYLQVCPKADAEAELILPTGGGGNLAAGMIARQIGLPVRFVCAVNKNNVLSRFMETGQCSIGDIHVTLAPAMDIQFAYNLERVWYMCSGGDSSIVRKILEEVDDGKINVPASLLNAMKSVITVYTVDGDEAIKATIKRCWEENQYHICPHTAVGVDYFYNKGKSTSKPSAVMATASPLKFPEAIASSGVPPPTSDRMQQLATLKTRYIDLEKGTDWVGTVRSKVEEITKQL